MRRALALIAVTLIASACEGNEPAQPKPAQSQVPAAWSPPDRYVFDLRSSCGERALIGTFRIQVADGQVQSAKALDSSARAAMSSGFRDEIPTLEELLEEANQAERDNADLVEVHHDEDGRAVRIDIDYNENAIDDEACYLIRRFQSLASESAKCDATENDLSKEPNYPVDYIHRWTTEEGCDVRLDVLMTRQGEDACGGSKVADILMGTPLGRPHDSSRARIYIKDPTNVFNDAQTSQGFDSDADLPEDARDSGYRQDEAALWITPDDDRYIYLVLDTGVEKWPHDTSPPGCA